MRVILAAFLLLLVPTAMAQQPAPGCQRDCHPRQLEGEENLTDAPAWVALYAHVESDFRPAPLNVQPPGSEEPDVAYAPARDPEGVIFDSFSDAGLVEIEGGEWRTHSDPGFARTVRLRPGAVAYLHVSVDADASGPLPGGFVRDLRLESVLYLGRGSADDVEVGRGASESAAIVTDVGGMTVYEFRMPLLLIDMEWESVWEEGKPLRWVVQVAGPSRNGYTCTRACARPSGRQTPIAATRTSSSTEGIPSSFRFSSAADPTTTTTTSTR